jgi:hypothetical protein
MSRRETPNRGQKENITSADPPCKPSVAAEYPPGGARRAGANAAAAPASSAATAADGAAQQLDRLGNHLARAGLRLARLRRGLVSSEDRLMLVQARCDLDEAMAEVRRLALSARQVEGN